MRSWGALALVAIAVAAASAAAEPVQAVLSADSRPYQEAWTAFRAELGGDAAMSLAGARGSDAALGSARVVVAFGSKAALQEYRGDGTLIVTMAPAVTAHRRGRGEILSVAMTPSPRSVLASLRALQPGLAKLAIVWKSEFYGDEYLAQLREAGKSAGVEIVSVEIDENGDIPDQLRSLYGRVDALWLPPDPLVISESNFLLFRDFSLANRVPLYVPVAGLAERGATAAVGVDFRAIGRATAVVAERALAGRAVPRLTYTEPAETTLNRDSAAKVGLRVDAETLKTLARMIP